MAGIARIVVLGLGIAFASGATAADDHVAPTRCLSDCSLRIGIVSAFGAEADLLVAQTRRRHDWLINGNRYTTGVLRGNAVVIVLSGVGLVNAAMTTQTMLDHFRIERLIMSGIAGGVNPANHIGDVIVPERWALPMEVYWNADASIPRPCGSEADVSCLGLRLAREDGRVLPDFRVSSNQPGTIGWFMRDNFVMRADTAPQGEFRFSFDADQTMLTIVRRLSPDLSSCGPREPARCVALPPRLRVGGLGVSGGAFLANTEYRAYLFETLHAEAVDMETAAFAQVAYANRVPFVAMRSVSDLAGGNDFTEVGAFFGSGLAEANEALVTLAFLEAWHKAARTTAPRTAHK